EPDPPKPKEPDPPKPKEPVSQKVEKPTVKKPSIEDRLKNAKVTQPKPVTPPKTNNAAKDISKRLENMQKNSSATISRSAANPNGLPAAQLSAYQNYLAGCLEPEMQRVWDACGPDRLPNPPKPVMVSLIVSPAGRVISGFVKEASDNELMNKCAKALLEKMKTVSLQPFSKTGLPTNASLTFQVYLNYKTGTSK
ncbi:MAG: hypothetical protein MJ106_03455, partial [Lentisphaeria bacterium]|nr:hypothetical protein [Lentisphaeria bacterium]